jgi:hypothetical protein
MAANQVQIVVSAKDEASKVLSGLSQNWQRLAASSVLAGLSVHGVATFMERSSESANRLQGALLGLSSVASAFGVNAAAAKQAAQQLASDGFMTVSDAAAGLKNLLASGFSLDQAINLMKGLKEQAAFNRQSFYELGGAVVATTEGIKNGNSVLADATGTTKNLSVMAKEAGVGIDEMGSISQNAAYQQAVYNGFMQETARSMGDLAKLSNTAAGAEVRRAAAVENFRKRLGELVNMIKTPLNNAFSDLLNNNQQLIISLGAAVVPAFALAGAIIAVAGALKVFQALSLAAAFSNPLILGLTALAVIAGVVVYKAIDKMQAKVKESNAQLGNMGDTVGKHLPQQTAAASKAMGDLQKKLADIDTQIAKANRDFRENLAEMVKSHEDKVASLQKQLSNENSDFESAYAEQTKEFKDAQQEMQDEYAKKAGPLEAAIQRELALGQWADQNRLHSLQTELAKEKAEYDKQVADKQAKYDQDAAKAKATHDKKTADLQAQLDTETALLTKHAADVAGIRDVTLLDEIDKLKRSHDEQLAAFQKQRDEAIGNAQQTAAGVSDVWNNANGDLNAQLSGMGSSMGKAMGEAFKQALIEVFVDTGKKLLAFTATLASMFSPAGLGSLLGDLVRNKGNVAKTIDERWKTIAGSIGGDKLVNGRASGGPVTAGRPYLVGEEGPELVVPRQDGNVIPAGQTALLGGRSINVTNHIYNQVDMDAMVRDLSWRLQLA